MELFHGTSEAGAADILEAGMRPSPTATWFVLTDDPDQAWGYARGRPDPVVLSVDLDEDAVWRRGASRAQAYLWPGAAHDVYGYKATVYAIRREIPAEKFRRYR